VLRSGGWRVTANLGIPAVAVSLEPERAATLVACLAALGWWRPATSTSPSAEMVPVRATLAATGRVTACGRQAFSFEPVASDAGADPGSGAALWPVAPSRSRLALGGLADEVGSPEPQA
jgi:hypothetical protein